MIDEDELVTRSIDGVEMDDIEMGEEDGAATAESWRELLTQEFWQAAKPEDFADNVEERFQQYMERLRALGIAQIVNKSMRMFHSMGDVEEGDAADSNPSFGPEFLGEQGEFIYTRINHYRNHILHQKSIVIPEKFAFEPQAKTSDAHAMEQVDIARALIDHAVETRGMGQTLEAAVEAALVQGRGWILLDWDLHSNDVVAERLGLMDVACHDAKSAIDREWVIVRTYKSRWTLAARAAQAGDYELATAIAQATATTESTEDSVYEENDELSDQLEVLICYCKPTPQLPEGRYSVIVREDGLIVEDGPFPFSEIHVYDVTPSTFVNTNIPYSNSWDLMPLHTLENAAISSIATRVDALAIPNITIEEGTVFSPDNSGLSVWTTMPNQRPPAVLDFLGSNSTLHQLIGMYESMGEKISGVNSVSRGQPNENINSGSYAALIQAQSVTFNGPVDQAVTHAASKVASGVIRLFQRMAKGQKIVALTGMDGRRVVKEFQAGGVSDVLYVHVERTSPLTRTHAWKQDAAMQLLQMRPEITPHQFLSVVKTGTYSELFADPVAREAHINEENIRLTEGEQIQVGDFERHDEHLRSHAARLDSRLRASNPAAAAAILAHCEEHVMKWMQATMQSPAMLAPLGVPPAPMPAAVQGMMSKVGLAPPPSGGKPPEPLKPPEQQQQKKQPGPPPGPKGPMPNPSDRMPTPATPAKPK